jgi:hypothetical protein
MRKKNRKEWLLWIDNLINPFAIDEPFMYCDKIEGVEKYELPTDYWLAPVYEFDEEDKHWIWCVRWLPLPKNK